MTGWQMTTPVAKGRITGLFKVWTRVTQCQQTRHSLPPAVETRDNLGGLTKDLFTSLWSETFQTLHIHICKVHDFFRLQETAGLETESCLRNTFHIQCTCIYCCEHSCLLNSDLQNVSNTTSAEIHLFSSVTIF